MRIGILSNVTVDMLAQLLGKKNEVYIPAGFDTWQQECMDNNSGLYCFKPEAVVVLLHAGAVNDIWNNRVNAEEYIDGWVCAVEILCSNLSAVPVLVSDIDIVQQCCFGAEVRNADYLENYFISAVELLHKKGYSVYALPVSCAVTDLGRKNFYSPKMWYMGSMPYSMKGLDAISSLINTYTRSVKGAKKKCLAVDLDNTLWGGVIGEDGVDGILLSEIKEGARYKDTQRLLKKMKNQGVMLAVLSKNNEEDVESAFRHPDMVLHHEDFVAEIINWESKSSNIKKLADRLNIGLDSFVFLDDNPAEREQMRAECPEVVVIDFPEDSALLSEVVSEAYKKYFFSLEITNEDVSKTEMYRAEVRRKRDRASVKSVTDFLKNLEMTIDIHLMREEEENRVIQLINKTNQFNLTTKRYSREEVDELKRTSDIITVHTSDKYGDQGLVAVLILKYEKDKEDGTFYVDTQDSPDHNRCSGKKGGTTASVDTFLMSCRVMGRKLEDEIMAQIGTLLERRHVNYLRATYIKTAKNAPVVDFYDKLKFDLVGGTENEKRYEAQIDILPSPTGVFRRVTWEW